MQAKFVQVDQAELSRIQANPSLAEMLFEEGPLLPPAFLNLSKVLQERMRASGPQMMAGALSRFPPELRKQLEARIGRTAAAMATGEGGEDLLKLMESRRARLAEQSAAAEQRPRLSLEKAWHGLHYLLCGEVEPGGDLLSQPVLGGVALGDDDEGFSGYGPARYFTAAQVAALARELSRPEVESAAAARFDAALMSELQIYPGWRPPDAGWLMDAFRRLRDFYNDAAAHERCVVTCLV